MSVGQLGYKNAVDLTCKEKKAGEENLHAPFLVYFLRAFVISSPSFARTTNSLYVRAIILNCLPLD